MEGHIVMSTDAVLSTEAGDCVQKTWIIKRWKHYSKLLVAAEASFHVEVGNPKVTLRFFLLSKEELICQPAGFNFVSKWYSLCAEVMTQLKENVVIQVTASAKGDGKTLVTAKSGAIPLNKSTGKVVEVIDRFLYSDYQSLDMHKRAIKSMPYYNEENIKDMAISVKAQMFRFTVTGNNVTPPAADIEQNLLAQAEDSLYNDLKTMFVAHQNYADLKLESKDHMTLDAHKFILAARSRYLQKYIDEAMKVENFNGTIKMNINGKPLVSILHWMYTGELNENAGSVMEELVDAAVLFELTPLMKLLDRNVITVCNKENMFRLYQVAQKNGMTNAFDDISAYIREHV